MDVVEVADQVDVVRPTRYAQLDEEARHESLRHVIDRLQLEHVGAQQLHRNRRATRARPLGRRGLAKLWLVGLGARGPGRARGVGQRLLARLQAGGLLLHDVPSDAGHRCKGEATSRSGLQRTVTGNFAR